MKKRFLFLAAALVAVLSANAQSLKGDVNKDGTVDVSDVTTVVDIILHPTAIAKPVTSITLSSTSLAVSPESTAKLTATVAPSDATLPDLLWTSSDESVATYVNGYIVGFAIGKATLTAKATDGSGVTATCEVTVPDVSGHAFVDLGLPSGLLWATCNVGANVPYEYGDYFAWGEATGYKSGKTTFGWSNYQWCEEGSNTTLTKYCSKSNYGYNDFTDALTTLEPTDDAATVQWGGDWRMPTEDEWNELNNDDYCTWTKYDKGNIEFNGVAGYKVTSVANGHSIFLPAAGCYNGSTLEYEGTDGDYWASSLFAYATDFASVFYFDSRDHDTDGTYRYYGQSIRPVIIYTATVPVTEIELSESSLKLTEWEIWILEATVTPDDATNPSVIWMSSDESVATVDADGAVTAVAEGTCTITATAADGSGVYATCEVTVVSSFIPVADIVLDYYLNLTVGEVWTLEATVTPDDATDPSVTWASSDESVATVDADGVVTAVAEGTCTITATATDDSGAYATCEVTVTSSFIPVTEIELSESSLNLTVGEVWTLAIDLHPLDATITSVVWTSSDESVATVAADGVVIALAEGTCTITVTAADDSGVSASCEVTVTSSFIPVIDISLSESIVVMIERDAVTLTATVTPDDATDPSVTWASSDESVATVDDDGVVTALAEGTCTITATAVDGSGVSASCTVRVVTDPSRYVSGYEYVDLGLPSGLLWATCNVGANVPYEYGDYFAWGETEPKDDYTWETYTYCNGISNYLTKYCNKSDYGYGGRTDGLTTLESADDAATQQWGGGWRMPTIAEWQELSHTIYCIWKWYDKDNSEFNGISGWKVTSVANGNYIFLPAAGHYSSSLTNSDALGEYWSTSLDESRPDRASYCSINQSGKTQSNNVNRCYGLSVRPVIENISMIPVTAISLSESSLEMTVGEETTLTATITPDDATITSVFWTSSDESVATVAGGVVTAVGAGTAIITAKTFDGGFTATCEVTVAKPYVPVTVIALSESSLEMTVGDETTLTVTVTPDDATIPSIIWMSSDESVATVDKNGVVKAKAEGTCTITAIAVDEGGYTASCKVTVTKPYVPVTDIALSESSLKMPVGEKTTLTATVTPDDATDPSVTWTSSDASVATVAGGVVTAVGAGTAILTATAADGSGVSASCTVKVLDFNGHAYVDLGLPSGTLWATCNMGAANPYDYGDYYAWGETQPKDNYTWETYTYCNGTSQTLTKYCNKSDYGAGGYTDGLTTLQSADDAATQQWRGSWRMPTIAEWQELNNATYCTWKWYKSGNSDFNGVAGYKVTSVANGNYIFLPIAGYRDGTSLSSGGSIGKYWSSSLYESTPSLARIANMNSSSHNANNFPNRYWGVSVRPVVKP